MSEVKYNLSRLETLIITITVSLAVFMFVLDYTIANVAIPYIAGGLASGVEEGTYVLTFFSVGNAIALPMTGWFSKRFGLIKTLIWSVALFTFCSWLCAIAFSLESLVFFRFLQGASAGPMIPLSQAILAMIHPRHKLNNIMAIFSMVVLVAPVFGPIVGGYFCVEYDWRWIFNINVPVGIFCTIVLAFILAKYNEFDRTAKVDYISFFLLLIGMTTLQLLLDKGQQWDWLGSMRIRVCAITTILCVSYLLLWSFTTKNPLLHLRLLRNREFAVSTILIFFMYSLYIGSVVLIPLWLQTTMGYDALKAGIAVCPIGIGSVVLSTFVAKLMDWYGRVLPMMIGFIVMGLATLYTRYFNTNVDLYHVMLSRFFLGIGISFWVVPLIVMPAKALAAKDLSNGLGIFHFVRSLAGGIGTSVYTTLYSRRMIHQHFNLTETFNVFHEPSALYLKKIESVAIFPERTLTVANNLLDQQAAVLSLDEVSMVMVYVCMGLCVITLFAKGGAKESPRTGPVIAD